MIITGYRIVVVSVKFQYSGFPRPWISESFLPFQEDKARQDQGIVMLLSISSRETHNSNNNTYKTKQTNKKTY